MDDLLPPAPSLRPYLEGYWQRSGVYAPPKKVRVMADACSKLIFELAPSPWLPCYLIATQLSPIVVTLSGRVDRIGIRFRPGAAGFILRRSLDGLANQLTCLRSLKVADLHAQLQRAAGARERADMLDQWLFSLLPLEEADQEEWKITREVASLLQGGLGPPAVAARLGWSERRLQRICRKRFGTTAASLHRLYRFERLHKGLTGRPTDLAHLAVALGFSDQAHMAREFREFADTTISAFLREQAAVGNLQDTGGWLPVLRELERMEGQGRE